MTNELLELISQLPLFESLPRSLVKKTLNGTLPMVVPRGKSIALQGDRAGSLAIVLNGLIKVYRLFPEGKEITIRLMQDGDVVLTDLGRVGDISYNENYEVIRDANVIFIGKAHLQACMAEHPELAMAMLSVVHTQAQCLADEITLVKWQYLPQRVASFLAGLDPEGSGAVKVRLPYEKTLLAARLGASRESLSRAFAELRAIGVNVQNMVVAIDDLDRLREFSETSSHDLRTRCEGK
ncbi:MAG: hypothetical protein C0605_00570 [Hyphomicrobiales bacterium]|nr:MAG: hypothetical protein C0605_00570 [Hyphomicrobiales bacterium]